MKKACASYPGRKRKRVDGHGQRDVRSGQYPKTCRQWMYRFDSTRAGKTIKICNIIDEYTREHLAFILDKKIDAGSVIELLDLA